MNIAPKFPLWATGRIVHRRAWRRHRRSLCSRAACDFGGEVVKIEGPEGDSTRRRGPFPDSRPDPEASGQFLYLNINKRGVVLDINREDGRDALDGCSLRPTPSSRTCRPRACRQLASCMPRFVRGIRGYRDHHHAVRVERPVGRTARR